MTDADQKLLGNGYVWHTTGSGKTLIAATAFRSEGVVSLDGSIAGQNSGGRYSLS